MVSALSPVEGKHALWAGARFGNVGLLKSLKKKQKQKQTTNKDNIWNTGVIAKITSNVLID